MHQDGGRVNLIGEFRSEVDRIPELAEVTLSATR
jgi:hypothetical protein